MDSPPKGLVTWKNGFIWCRHYMIYQRRNVRFQTFCKQAEHVHVVCKYGTDIDTRTEHVAFRADSRFAPSQWGTALLCNDVSHWLGASLESAISFALIWCEFEDLLFQMLVISETTFVKRGCMPDTLCTDRPNVFVETYHVWMNTTCCAEDLCNTLPSPIIVCNSVTDNQSSPWSVLLVLAGWLCVALWVL